MPRSSTVTLCNAAGEKIREFADEWQAVAWWRIEGMESDYLDESDELVSDVAMRQEGMT